MTGVVSSSMSGTRVSGFRKSLIGNNEKATTYARNEISGDFSVFLVCPRLVYHDLRFRLVYLILISGIYCITDVEIEQIGSLTNKVLKTSVISKKGYK